MFNEIKTHEITVDIVILTIKNDALQVLLVKRNKRISVFLLHFFVLVM